MGVNQRINRIAHDRIFTRHLHLLEYCRIDDSSLPLSDLILNRFCSRILPEIGHEIETLYLEGTSIERVLHATNYPNLNNLGLCDIDDKLAMSFFSGLHVNVISMMDCLEILDGHFDQLRILYINLYYIRALSFNKERNENLLPNLRIFSLRCDHQISLDNFKESVVSLLRRMINLEVLDLNITVQCYEKFIDGDILKKDIMIHMAQLYKFTFNIYSTINHRYQTNFALNESIEKTFKYFSNNQIITCIDHFQRYSRCHIYSYPYQWKIYDHITNNFRDGLFTSVTQVLLRDEHPFEHEFFLRISKSFPFMKQLTIMNWEAQQIKSNNDDKILSIIEYPNLTRLDLTFTHDDYVQLFLFNMKMSLPNNLHLRVDYESLERVTYCFTRYMTGNNSTKLAALYFDPGDQIDEYHIKNYFPYACIHRTFRFILSK
ncbi:unnamed protein product [Rotaria sordida]|uniref:Uncharacterized protein n=1 Tax=Rotaria sordida TaxID=392033 RepID=A0A815PF04_9BILA|nr:unnamed protein product [Rotaria sordida]